MKVGDMFLGRLVVGITNSHLLLKSNNAYNKKDIWIKYKKK